VAIALSAAMAGSCREETHAQPRVIVVGFDGMDPVRCTQMMDRGELPNLARMRANNGFRPLATTVPPQSPVAWATFINGTDPGGHGVFDFVHRDPARQCAPYYSAAETISSEDGWAIGDYVIPLPFWPFNHQAPQTKLLRGGTAFWDYLDEAGVPVRLYDIPANYPPSPSHHGHTCCLSGMGVPDLLGTLGGKYQLFSEKALLAREEPGGGGMRRPLVFRENRATGELTGPANVYHRNAPSATIPFTIFRHPEKSTARIDIQERSIVLNEGEWSAWQQLDFVLEMPGLLPDVHLSGICRFYLQAVHPMLSVYVTPINIDPSDPGEQRISEPAEFVTEISEALGLFYTAGFQEDHKALSNRVFSDAEYKRQADYVLGERLDLMDYAMEEYRDGLLFFYFSSTDLQAHLFWWDSDDKHPIRDPAAAKQYNDVITDLYRRMDDVVGRVVERFGDDATILVMSDHGFANFSRQFNLNTWLRDEGHVRPENCRSLLDPSKGTMVDWGRTKAYGLGLNGLYVNLQGREAQGIVKAEEREALMTELEDELLAIRDPVTGRPVVKTVYRREDVYHGPYVEAAPDLIVGYHRDYRASWATTLGDLTDEALADNDSAWSGDHCIAADEVPGVLFSNRPILRDEPSLLDLAPTVLDLFAVPAPEAMAGGSVFEKVSG
jgi:predicted AlkP superfamily phosphohydrolase/phosphomutase